MSRNIIDKAIDYLEQVQRQSGSVLYFEEKPSQAMPQTSFTSEKPTTVKPEIDSTIARVSTPPASAEPIAKVEKRVAPKESKFKVPLKAFEHDDSIASDWQKSASLIELNENIKNCLNCQLGKTRTNFVFGKGNPNADLMIIGEAPGADEDSLGEPFVGRAGQLLTKILEAINFSRDDVFIGNIIKCRPPANRPPTNDEVAACEPFLLKQIELIKPQFILALGLTAADTLFKKSHKMGDIRGKLFDYNGIPTMVTYHPAALLRNPGWKKAVWEDVQILRKMYDDWKNSTK